MTTRTFEGDRELRAYGRYHKTTSMKTYTFELELRSGKLDLFTCEADNWKRAWQLLSDYIRVTLSEEDSVVNVGNC